MIEPLRTQRKHGPAYSPEWIAWHSMIARCENPSCEAWIYYGYRGMTVCKEWRHDFAAFLRDVGPRPSAQHRLGLVDRKPNAVFKKGNAVWMTRSESDRRRTSNVFYTVGKTTRCLQDWANETGISKSTLHYRLAQGMTMRAAIARGRGRKGKSGSPLATR